MYVFNIRTYVINSFHFKKKKTKKRQKKYILKKNYTKKSKKYILFKKYVNEEKRILENKR